MLFFKIKQVHLPDGHTFLLIGKLKGSAASGTPCMLMISKNTNM